MIRISVCLNDIPEDRITKSPKNGKMYVELIVDKRREADNYGNTHTVYVNQTKEERQARTQKKYVGNGKSLFNEQPATQQNSPNSEAPAPNKDDLPF